MIKKVSEMNTNNVKRKYQNYLSFLVERKLISITQFEHFSRRGIQLISPGVDLGLDTLAKLLPEIIISASPEYIKKMKVPYQATSFLAAKIRNENEDSLTNTSPVPYIYKLSGKPGGGVTLLAGGKRRIGDNVFASTHRILLGCKAIAVSALNLMINKDKIWNWEFFGRNIKNTCPDLYLDLVRLHDGYSKGCSLYQVIIARSENTFKKLQVVENYRRNKIAVLNPANKVRVIFITDQGGYDYASKAIRQSELTDYIVTGNKFNITEGLEILRRKYSVDIMLNDGGRQMSNGMRDLGALAEERVTLEPFPGKRIIPDEKEIEPSSIMAMGGLGLDGNELEQSILIHSTIIGNEKANVYAYPLNESIVL
jgi:hypothetical protein